MTKDFYYYADKILEWVLRIACFAIMAKVIILLYAAFENYKLVRGY